MLQKTYVWEWPVRITHWLNAICILVLSVTGYYIGDPFYTANSTSQYLMGWNRAIHFFFAYLFTASVLTRILWAFLGNRYASWRTFFPWASRGGWKYIIGTFNYYTFLRARVPHVIGHNALAAMAYSAVFLLFVLQILTGFALYGQYAPGSGWDSVLGWMLPVFGSQWLRLTHHMIMWLLIGFAIHHVYSGWLMDVKEQNGTMGSIFGGYKFIDPKEL
ncbi:Ni/Fe-hydrogenase, b-type cytochrome subunit [Desulfuromonas versatilis]|uniref:Ni/Fe-hydrogenase, b-type cytochrome subunit n=1 Tax=Desulfuromonas versatilis TaxID=2802975 RepID=A0ABM8I233_9BACT|nr:Ni/Fe-hydrogenase, b-type cytochrome subunit [Desulfuromonas versatilis]BCR06881.1 Ni/Fe-hydrogenase, b-type cytochrome subunit [Desulfuromonas versatilis]